jgi:hypothetical protein
MRQIGRFCLVLLCVAGLCSAPASGAGRGGGARRRVLGVVSQTNLAYISNSNAVLGADIYSCEPLNTDNGGALRVRVGSSQVYLSSASASELEDDGGEIQALANSGTVGFSQTTPGELAVRTPAGVVRATGGPAAGEITFKGPKELVITAIRSDLTLDNGGELRTIPEGKSADVTFDDSNSQGCHDGAAVEQQQSPLNRPKIGFIIVGTAAVLVPSALLWHDLAESDSKPKR